VFIPVLQIYGDGVFLLNLPLFISVKGKQRLHFDFVHRFGVLQIYLFRNCDCFRPGRTTDNVKYYSPAQCNTLSSNKYQHSRSVLHGDRNQPKYQQRAKGGDLREGQVILSYFVYPFLSTKPIAGVVTGDSPSPLCNVHLVIVGGKVRYKNNVNNPFCIRGSIMSFTGMYCSYILKI
jgi:hypothetical protein